MAALLKFNASQITQPAANPASVVGSLQQRLTLAYCAFTSATLALLLFGVMTVVFAAQLNDDGLYRIAYSDQLSQESRQIISLRQSLADGTLQGHNLSQWLKGIPSTRSPFTEAAYAEFIAPDGTILAQSESPTPAWATGWKLQSNYKENMIFDFDNQGPIGAQVFTRQTIESLNEIRSTSGELLGSLRVRYSFRNMWLLYWLAGGTVWLLLAAITLGLGSLFGRWAAQPLAQRLAIIAQTTESWARGDLERRLPDTSPDEIGRLSRRLNTMSEQLRTVMAQQQALATTEERQRLARELHDSVKQQVFAISMQLGSVALALPAEPALARQLLQEAQITIQATHAELASLIFALRPAALQLHGLAAALTGLAEGWNGRGQAVVEFSASGVQAAPLEVEHALFRVAQEALANAIRHSGAQQVRVALRRESEVLTLSIFDDGTGFNPAGPHAGLGLVSMQTRMREVGGDLTIQSASGQGTEILALWRPAGAV